MTLQDRYQEQDAVDEQLKCSTQKLYSLLRDGKEMVTNVVVADDRREIIRRMDEVSVTVGRTPITQ